MLHALFIACAAILGITALGFAILLWAVRVPHTPDLTPVQAERIISERPEFHQSRSLIGVSDTTRAADSLKDCCYTAKFTFTPNGSRRIVTADAEFGYWDGAWHLQGFSYGEPPNVETVGITSDVP